MAYGDKIGLIIFSCIVLFIVLYWLGNKFYIYRVNKYNNKIKNKLRNATKYLFGEIYNEYFENGQLYYIVRDYHKVFAKTIFVDKKNVIKMVSFANHVFKKYECEYTHRIWLMAYDIQRFACKYKSLDEYLYKCGLNNKSTLDTITNKYKNEIIEIEKKKLFNM